MTFVKGVSGNLKGRPVGSISLVDILRRKLGEVPAGTSNSRAEAIVDAYLAEAMEKSDLKRDMFDRIDGKPKQDLGLTGADGGPVKIEVEVRMV